jgi:hypothetical protein
VVVLRCTARLFARMKRRPDAEPSIASTTKLGDWYANVIHIDRVQLALCVSERTLLPVVLPAAPFATLPGRLPMVLAEVLRELGVSDAGIEAEAREMSSVAFAKPANRQILGVLVDCKRLLDAYFDYGVPLVALSLKLAETPWLFRTGDDAFPNRATSALFRT